MPTTDPIVITPSTSVVLVNTADYSGNPIVLLPNIDSLGRVITIRDADGGSDINPIYISTTGGALFQPEISTVTISSFIIDQPYGFYTITPRTTDPSGTRYGVMNAYAFREATDFAYVNMFNTNMSYVSTLSTVNLGVGQDLGVSGSAVIGGSISVGGSITYVNPGAVSFSANTVNATNISTNTIKAATIYTSTAYASSIYLANTLEASTLRLSARPIFDLSGAGSWSNYMAGGVDPNSMTLGDPVAYAGAQIATDGNFFGIRSFNATSSNFSTTIITRDGNVGINLPYTNLTYSATNPNYNLAVKGALRLSNYDTRAAQNNIIFRADGSTAGSSNRYVNTFGTESNYTLYSASNQTHGFYYSGGEYKWMTADKGTSYPETIKFWTSNNQERMRINSNGYVGIGTTSPDTYLDVSGSNALGTARFTQYSNVTQNPYPTIRIQNADNGSHKLDIYNNLTYHAYNDIVEANDKAIIFSDGTLESGNLVIAPHATGPNGLRITSNGYVGIGLSIPAVTLDVSGQIKTNNSIMLPNGSLTRTALNFGAATVADANTGLYHPLDNTIGFVINGADAVRIDNASRVGIGKTNPGQPLDVNGAIAANSISTISMSTATVFAGPGSAALPPYVFNGDADTGFYSPAANTVGIATSGTNKLTITSGGTVGIGATTTPNTNYKLVIDSLGATGSILLDGSTQAVIDNARNRGIDGSLANPTYSFSSDENTGLYRPVADNIGVVTGGVERVRFDDVGKVGIAKTDPAYTLDVSGTARVSGGVIFKGGLSMNEGSAGAPAINFGAATVADANTGIYQPIENTIGFSINGSERVRIDTAGKVGIAKTDPAYTLDVSGSAAVRNSLSLNEGSAAAPSLNFAVGTYTGTGIGLFQPTTNMLGFTTAGAERARINNAGYFGIGTTSPDTFLDVFGNSALGTGRFIQFGTATPTANPVLCLQNEETGATTSNQINFHTNLTAGSYNSLTQAGDKAIIYTNGTLGTGNLVIAPWTNGSYGLRMTNTGQVGIGQAIPTQVLDVSGSIKTTTSIMLPDGTAAAPALCFSDDTDTGIHSPANGVVAITADGLERMRINASWQVGIGKSTGLTYNLDVSGLIGANGLYVNAPGATGIYMSNANAIYGKNTALQDQLCLIPRHSDNNTYLNYGTGGFFYVRNNSSANRLAIGDAAHYMYFGETGTGGNPVYTYFDQNSIQIGVNRSTNGNAFIDLISDNTYTDYGLRIVREAGANANSIIAHKGTNPLIITAQDAGNVIFKTQDSERMRINSSGNVSIQTVGSGYSLEVNGKSFFKDQVYFGADTTSGFIRMIIQSGISYIQSSSNTTGTHNKLYFTGYDAANNTMALDIPNQRVGIGGQTSPTVALDVTGDIKASGNITAYSDERFKTNIHPIVNALEKVSEMRGVSYTTKEEGRHRIGVIAQEIEKIIPEVVLTDDTENHYKSVDYGNIVAVLIEAIKELKAKVDALSSGDT